jgi:hypothetical protein
MHAHAGCSDQADWPTNNAADDRGLQNALVGRLLTSRPTCTTGNMLLLSGERKTRGFSYKSKPHASDSG